MPLKNPFAELVELDFDNVPTLFPLFVNAEELMSPGDEEEDFNNPSFKLNSFGVGGSSRKKGGNFTRPSWRCPNIKRKVDDNSVLINTKDIGDRYGTCVNICFPRTCQEEVNSWAAMSARQGNNIPLLELGDMFVISRRY